MSEKVKVMIHCLVYNHEPYLRDCLEGFVSQKTDFPFKAIVHDDCSTDGSAAIIREYAEKYPHIIEPIYETENQWRKGTLNSIMYGAILGRSPYIAYCEGDDYWIDPYKLQKQVDYMDAHPECTMTCSNVELLTPKGIINDSDKRKNEWFFHEKSKLMSTEEVIHTCGHTCTLMIRSALFDAYPEVCKKCGVGDYPLQIYAALQGTVYCFAEKTSVYRFQTPSSYTTNYKTYTAKLKSKIIRSITNMLDSLNKLSQFKYNQVFNNKIYSYLIIGTTKNYTTEQRIYSALRAFRIHPIKTLNYFYSAIKAKIKIYYKGD